MLFRSLADLWAHKSRVEHVIHFSVGSNGNLDGGGNERAIESNWRVNRVSRKFRGTLKKES